MEQKPSEIYEYIGKIHVDFHFTMTRIQEEASAKIRELLEQVKIKDKRIKELEFKDNEFREGNTTNNIGDSSL